MSRYTILRDDAGNVRAATVLRYGYWSGTLRKLAEFAGRDPSLPFDGWTTDTTDEPPTLDVAIDEETARAILADTADDETVDGEPFSYSPLRDRAGNVVAAALDLGTFDVDARHIYTVEYRTDRPPLASRFELKHGGGHVAWFGTYTDARNAALHLDPDAEVRPLVTSNAPLRVYR